MLHKSDHRGRQADGDEEYEEVEERPLLTELIVLEAQGQALLYALQPEHLEPTADQSQKEAIEPVTVLDSALSRGIVQVHRVIVDAQRLEQLMLKVLSLP